MAEQRRSKFEKTQGTKILVSKAVADAIGETQESDMVGFSCSVKDASLNRGQKNDIDVTTWCSDAEEKTNGLSSTGEVSINVNWKGDDEGQAILEQAFEDDGVHEFAIIFKSGHGFRFLAEVRQADISIATNAVVTGTYTLRLRGKAERIELVVGP